MADDDEGADTYEQMDQDKQTQGHATTRDMQRRKSRRRSIERVWKCLMLCRSSMETSLIHAKRRGVTWWRVPLRSGRRIVFPLAAHCRAEM
eukprot:459689-Pleurochrysis_carterae.AAC.1